MELPLNFKKQFLELLKTPEARAIIAEVIRDLIIQDQREEVNFLCDQVKPYPVNP